MTRTIRHLLRPSLGAALSLLYAADAFAQSTVLQGGPWAAGHAPMYVGQGSSQPIIQDGGGAGGGPLGATPSELAITSRSATGTYPSANSGNGPNYSHFCLYDAPTTNLTGFHYFCLDPNSANGGLLSYGAAGGAATLPLQFNVNGSIYTFPFGGGGGGGGSVGLWSDSLNPTATNTFPPITNSYTTGAGGAATLIVNGVSYSDHAHNPVFAVFGQTVVWNPINAGFNVTTADQASITYTGLSGSNGGTVTSVGASVPSIMTISGSPVTTAGTLAFGLSAEPANTVFAGPTSGALATPTFRGLVSSDLPTQSANTLLGSLTATTPTGQAVPSCSTASSALIWTSGTGFGCNTIAGATPGGTSGQVQYNSAGTLAGFTVSGDGTLNTGTGALVVTKTNGTNFGALATVPPGVGVATAAGIDIGTAGSVVVNGGALGTPSSGTLTDATGLPLSTGTTGTLAVGRGGTGATTFTSNLPLIGAGSGAVTTGTRSGNTTTFATATGTLTNGHCVSIDASGNFIDAGGACTTGGGGGTVSAGTAGQLTYYAGSGTTVSGATTGTGVVTALGVNTGSAGAFVVNGGALGTPSSGTLTSATGLPLTTGVTGTLPVANGGTGTTTPALVAGTNVSITGSWPNQTINSSGGLTVGSSTVTSGTSGYVLYNNAGVLGNVATSGTGNVAFTTSPTFVTPALGTPASGVLTNATGLPLTTGVTGTLPVANGGSGAATLTGVLKGNGTSAFTAATAGTDFVAPGTATTFTATQTFNGSTSTLASVLANAAEKVNIVAAAPSATTNFYLNNGAVQYYTTNAANTWVINLAMSSGTTLNAALSTGQSVTFALLTTQGGTAYYPTAINVDGTAVGVSTKWQGGTAPAAGNINSIDAYQCSVVKTASATYTALCSQTQYK